LIEWPNLAGADALHFTSELERRDAERLGIPARRAAVIANGVDLAEIASAGDAPENPQPGPFAGSFVLHLGRINWKKGLDRLLRAMTLAPGIRAVIAGEDEEGCRASLEKLARECGVADRVRFLDPVYGAAKWRLLRAARALVLPSHSENFGNAVLEAMAAGKPVVVSPGVGLAAAVRDAGCGMVVEPEPGALAGALEQLWRDEPLCRAMGERGRALVEREYAWPRIAGQVVELYRSILDARAAGVARS
jgi:glycosyltransferase involved in cell wall biosynthesis